MLTFDFETEGIVGNPIVHPPKPVGVSIKVDGQPSDYLAWGHPMGNNTTWEKSKVRLLSALNKHPEYLCHNAPFEHSVLRGHYGVDLDTQRFHDTRYQVFLDDPYAHSLALKPSAERVLGWPSEEQDELKDWIMRHVPAAKLSDWGAYISLAPGGLVGKYAGDSRRTGAPGDTDRTYALHAHLMPRIEAQDMAGAYERERLLMPILYEASLRGVRIDVERLERDTLIYRGAQKICQEYIFSKLGEFELSKDAQLVAALERAGMITGWVLTKTGKKSVARKNLAGNIRDPELMGYLAYYNILETCLGTFALPWLAQAAEHGGRVHPQWNQIRGDTSGGNMDGTRTGRMSCKEPNFQNIPNDFEGLVIPAKVLKFLREMERIHKCKLWDVIHMRDYVLPEEGHIFLGRDFSSQEMRLLAHFAEGKLSKAFHDDPGTDPHEAVRLLLAEHAGVHLKRKWVKITGFGILYGRGVDSLGVALGVDRAAAESTRDAYYNALPEIRQLQAITKKCGRTGVPIVTWGGRRYLREPNPERDMSYKLMNYLIQGSAGDQTKQSMIDWHDEAPSDHLLIAPVHDEINLSVPEDEGVEGMALLKKNMDAPRFDVPFRSGGYFGPNWGELEDYDDY